MNIVFIKVANSCCNPHIIIFGANLAPHHITQGCVVDFCELGTFSNLFAHNGIKVLGGDHILS